MTTMLKIKSVQKLCASVVLSSAAAQLAGLIYDFVRLLFFFCYKASAGDARSSVLNSSLKAGAVIDGLTDSGAQDQFALGTFYMGPTCVTLQKCNLSNGFKKKKTRKNSKTKQDTAINQCQQIFSVACATTRLL